MGLVGGSNEVFARSRGEELNGGDARMVMMMQEVGVGVVGGGVWVMIG